MRNITAKRCTKCDSGCLTCTENGCDKCATGSYLDPVTQKCVTNCPEGYHRNEGELECVQSCIVTNTCDECSTKCSTCFGKTEESCLGCKAGLALDAGSNKCVSTNKECTLGEFAQMDPATKEV